MPKTLNATQKAIKPFHANGPILKQIVCCGGNSSMNSVNPCLNHTQKHWHFVDFCI